MTKARDWDWDNEEGRGRPAITFCAICGAVWLCDTALDTGLPQTTCPVFGKEHAGSEWGCELYEDDIVKTVRELITSHEPNAYDTADDDGNIWPAFDTGFYPVGVARDDLVGDWAVRA